MNEDERKRQRKLLEDKRDQAAVRHLDRKLCRALARGQSK